jgi:hypothetical protein
MKLSTTLFLSIFFLTAISQERSKKLVKSLESSNPEEYQRLVSDLKRTPEELKVELGSSQKEASKNETVSSNSSKQSSAKTTEASVSSSSKPANTPANTSAIAHGEARNPSAAVAKNYKYKADEKSVEYYNDLRKKFEEEEKIRKEKEALMTAEKAKKDEEVKQGRRLTEDQAPQFDRFRQGEKNPVVTKTSAEEDYKSLFK